MDARAGLPAGSTSAYYRTRKALIEALVRRVAELDTVDIQRGGSFAPADLDQLAEQIAGVLDEWLTTGRTRTLACYACLLAATHHPELRTILRYGDTSRAQARVLLAAMGAEDPERAGAHFVACVDGLLFDRLIGAGALAAPPPGTPESRADLAVAVRVLLRAVSGR